MLKDTRRGEDGVGLLFNCPICWDVCGTVEGGAWASVDGVVDEGWDGEGNKVVGFNKAAPTVSAEWEISTAVFSILLIEERAIEPLVLGGPDGASLSAFSSAYACPLLGTWAGVMWDARSRRRILACGGDAGRPAFLINLEQG